MQEEGYIKFKAEWKLAAAFPLKKVHHLLNTRQVLFEQGLIGAYPDGIGFGNLSMRWGEDDQFLISGSRTGGLAQLSPEELSLVTQVDINQNLLHCQGPIIASSESMSHSMIYQCCPSAKVAIHVHDLASWERLLAQVPTTDSKAPYGSPEMAWTIQDLFENSDLLHKKILVMSGHREGIFVFGKDFKEALEVLLRFGVCKG